MVAKFGTDGRRLGDAACGKETLREYNLPLCVTQLNESRTFSEIAKGEDSLR